MKKVSFKTNNYELLDVTDNQSYEDADFVYNIEVNVDHSYVINGMAVKNCRCRWLSFNPELQYVDENGSIKVKYEDIGAWKKWRKEHKIDE